MSTSIKVENISKAYELGEIGTGTLSQDLERWFARIRGKEDPFLKVGETNDRAIKGNSNIVWSLKDINFEIEEGDAVGIIGRNGAGKSTLLKILSRVTSPTSGSISGKGRIASLLEVGTGFHPELTGRENIYLNGAILGMRKREIASKFNAIVEFAGVERYIDTPVKRYSSGMYVRLAFAVAAHLESEILIIDEVLAVGDAEFQKRCLGKMEEIRAGEGRTILFVSHSMSSILQFCNKGILLNNGTLATLGEIKSVVNTYQGISKSQKIDLNNYNKRKGNGLYRVTNIRALSNNKIDKTTYNLGDIISFQLEIKKTSQIKVNDLRIIIGVYNSYNEAFIRFDSQATNTAIELKDEISIVTCNIKDRLNIRPDNYYLNVAILQYDELIDYIQEAIKFSVENYDYFDSGREMQNPELAKVYYKYSWNIDCVKN